MNRQRNGSSHTPTAASSAGLRLSTGDLASTSAIEAWRSHFGHTICQTDIDPLPGEAFRSDVVLRALPGLGVASGECSGARYWRPSSLIVDDDLIFVVNHRGVDFVDTMGRQTEVRAGEAVLVTTGATGGIINKGGARFTTIRAPRNAIESALPDLHAAMVKAISADNRALRLLLNYISVLEDDDVFGDEAFQSRVVRNVHDLIVLALGPTRDAMQTSRHRGAAAARLRAIKADIRDRIFDGIIQPDKLAGRHGITPRYLQMLFEQDGATLSEFVLMERLTAAHRLLRDPSRDHEKIVDIAFSVGFGDVSYFNRVFRRRFGKTPSELRASASRTARAHDGVVRED